MRFLSDAQIKMRMTPIQTQFANVIESMEDTVQKVSARQKQKQQTDKSQSQQISELEHSLNCLRRDFNVLKNQHDKELYEKNNMERIVNQLQNDKRNLENRLAQLERKN